MGSEMCIRDRYTALTAIETAVKGGNAPPPSTVQDRIRADSARLPNPLGSMLQTCLLYTSDAADERSSVDLGGRRIIKKKKKGETGVHS